MTMELDREKLFAVESVLQKLLANMLDLIHKCYPSEPSSSIQAPSANQMMRLLQDCRVSTESLLMLGIGLPADG